MKNQTSNKHTSRTKTGMLRKNVISILSLLFLLTSLPMCKQKSKDKGSALKGQVRYISTKAGLRIREDCTLKSKIIGVIPYNTEVTIIKEQGENKQIAGATGKWTQVTWMGKTGCVFGGFLSTTEGPPVTVNESMLFGTWCPKNVFPGDGCYQLNSNYTGLIPMPMGVDGTWQLIDGFKIEMDFKTPGINQTGQKEEEKPYHISFIIQQVINNDTLVGDLTDPFTQTHGIVKLMRYKK